LRKSWRIHFYSGSSQQKWNQVQLWLQGPKSWKNSVLFSIPQADFEKKMSFSCSRSCQH
jgi:hypothetical protein